MKLYKESPIQVVGHRFVTGICRAFCGIQGVSCNSQITLVVVWGEMQHVLMDVVVISFRSCS